MLYALCSSWAGRPFANKIIYLSIYLFFFSVLSDDEIIFVGTTLASRSSIGITSQLTNNVVVTLFRRRCDVMTSQRRRSNVYLTLCVCWVSGADNPLGPFLKHQGFYANETLNKHPSRCTLSTAMEYYRL